jgi:hypothetical protein
MIKRAQWFLMSLPMIDADSPGGAAIRALPTPAGFFSAVRAIAQQSFYHSGPLAMTGTFHGEKKCKRGGRFSS